jgi:hypothetical protein
LIQEAAAIGRMPLEKGNNLSKPPSAAAAVVKDRSSNAPKTWTVVESGQTFRDWGQQSLISS